MKKRLILRLAVGLLALCMMAGLALTASAAYPAHNQNIYDGANILSDSLVESIKSTNEALYSKVEAKIYVCAVESLGGEDIQSYALGLFQEWNIIRGVLLLVSTGDDNYYAIQSQNIEDTLTNTRLRSILEEFLFPDFDAGNAAKGIQKTVNKLASFLKSELSAKSEKNNQNGEQTDTADKDKATFGSVVLSVLKILGWTAVVIVAAFIILFIAALFSDTAANLMYRLVFVHFTGKKKTPMREDYYDERLYGPSKNSQRLPQNGSSAQRRSNPNGGRPAGNPNRQGRTLSNSQYNGTRQIQRNPQNNGTKAPSRSAPNPDFSETRKVSIPTRTGNKNNR